LRRDRRQAVALGGDVGALEMTREEKRGKAAAGDEDVAVTVSGVDDDCCEVRVWVQPSSGFGATIFGFW
jgi:hypothetical protein